MRDVAKVAGVSAKTVSRVFNDDPHVTVETRERVLWAIDKLNYVPNMLARSFRAGADAAVGLAFPDVADPFFAAMTRSIEDDLAQRGMVVVVTSLGNDVERERATVESLLRRQISGLIIASIRREQSYLAPWQERTPIVFVDRSARGLPTGTVVSVTEDDQAGAREAITHLAAHGHRRIAFVGMANQVMTTRSRASGYRATITSLGLAATDDLVFTGTDTPEAVAEELVARLGRTDPPTAVFSATIPCTMAVILALQRARRTDVALVGFGDFPMADAIDPGVTVLDQNPAMLGRVAVERLVARLENPGMKPQLRTVLPVRLIARGSGELPPPSAEQRAGTR